MTSSILWNLNWIEIIYYLLFKFISIPIYIINFNFVWWLIFNPRKLRVISITLKILRIMPWLFKIMRTSIINEIVKISQIHQNCHMISLNRAILRHRVIWQILLTKIAAIQECRTTWNNRKWRSEEPQLFVTSILKVSHSSLHPGSHWMWIIIQK